MIKQTNIKTNLNPQNENTIKNKLKLDYDLNISTNQSIPDISGTVGKIVFNSLKTTGNESNLVEIYNDTTGNKSYILLHPSGSFELFDNDGNHILKTVGDNVIVGKNIIVEASDSVLIKADDSTGLTDELVTVSKLIQCLSSATVTTVSLETPTPILFTPLLPVADLGTKNIKVGKGS